MIGSQKEFLKKRYLVEDGKIIVELKLAGSRHLFDRKDPSPIKERDLNEDVVDYVYHSFLEIPSRYQVVMRVFFDEDPQDQFLIERLKGAFRSYFKLEAYNKQRELAHTFKKGLISLGIGLSFLFLCIYASSISWGKSEGLASHFLLEGLTLLGWVSMWYPINIFLYDWWPIVAEKKQMQRIESAGIEIRYGRRPNIVRT